MRAQGLRRWIGALLLASPAATIAQSEPPAQPPADPPPEAQPEAPPAAPVPPPPPPPATWMDGWSGSIELGLTGSSGNTEELNFRGGFGAKRTSPFYETTIAFAYKVSTQEGDTTENQARLDLRNDWLLKDSKWRLFALGAGEYDDFQDWDFRVSAFGGVGYEFIKNDRTTLLGRAGLGASREIGGADNDIVPEAVLGADVEHKIDDRSKVTASIDFFPELSEIGPYRFVAKAAYEILVDPKNNMTLKLGFIDTYDSTPGDGFRRNDFDYFAMLVWSF